MCPENGALKVLRSGAQLSFELEYELWFLEQDAFASGNRLGIVGRPHKVILQRKPDRRSTKLHRNESKISNSCGDILEKVPTRPLILQHSLHLWNSSCIPDDRNQFGSQH